MTKSAVCAIQDWWTQTWKLAGKLLALNKVWNLVNSNTPMFVSSLIFLWLL